jgi:hypothetical protein
MSEQDDDKGNGFDTEEESRTPPRERIEEAQVDPDSPEEGFPTEAET